MPRDGAFVWAPTLIVWMALAALMGWAAPRAAYLWVLPLLAAAAPLALGRRRAWGGPARVGPRRWWPGRCCGFPTSPRCFGFLVALLGTFPIVAPVWTLPSLLLLRSRDARAAAGGAAGGQRMAAPALRHPRGAGRHGAVGRSGPTVRPPTRPSGRCAWHCCRWATATGRAPTTVLAVTGNEPAVDLGATAPLLTPAASVPERSRASPADAPFVSLGVAPEAEPAGRGHVRGDAGGVGRASGWRVTVVPAVEALQARLELPDGVRAAAQQLARAGRAAVGGRPAYVAVPRRGRDVRPCAAGRRRGPRPATAGCCCAVPGRSTRHRADCRPGSTGPGIAWDFRVVDVTPLR